MKLLFYLNRYHGLGGIEIITEKLAHWFKNQGNDVSILFFVKENDKVYNKNTRGLTMYSVPEADSQKTQEYVTILLVKENFDIIIFQDSYDKNNYKYLFNSKQALNNTKIITAEHNAPSALHNVYKNRLKRYLNNYDILRYIKHYLDITSQNKTLLKRRTYLYNNSDQYILLSESFIPEFKECSNVENLSKIKAINNALTTPTVISQKTRLKDVVFLGRLVGQKGISYLLKVYSTVAPLYPDWKFKIIGDGSERGEVEKCIKELGLPNIIYCGPTNCPEEYYKTASILTVTSIFEGWGLIIPEAMNYGVVPIAFDSYKSVHDIIDDGENGVLVTPFDCKLYAQKLCELIENRDRMLAMSEACIIKSNKFHIDIIGQQWLNLFKNIIFQD